PARLVLRLDVRGLVVGAGGAGPVELDPPDDREREQHRDPAGDRDPSGPALRRQRIGGGLEAGSHPVEGPDDRPEILPQSVVVLIRHGGPPRSRPVAVPRRTPVAGPPPL